MARYTVHEAKSILSQLLKKTCQGEEVIIMRDGEPIAELIPYRRPKRKKIRLGTGAGQVEYTKGWDKAMTDEEIEAFLAGRL